MKPIDLKPDVLVSKHTPSSTPLEGKLGTRVLKWCKNLFKSKIDIQKKDRYGHTVEINEVTTHSKLIGSFLARFCPEKILLIQYEEAGKPGKFKKNYVNTSSLIKHSPTQSKEEISSLFECIQNTGSVFNNHLGIRLHNRELEQAKTDEFQEIETLKKLDPEELHKQATEAVNLEKAHQLYRIAADKGHEPARLKLADLYLNDGNDKVAYALYREVFINLENIQDQSLELCREAAYEALNQGNQQGNLYAKFNLGVLHHYTAKDSTYAVKYYKELYDRKDELDAKTQYQLGKIYQTGFMPDYPDKKPFLPIEPDPLKATDLYQLASARNNPDALYERAMILQKRGNLPQERPLITELLLKAAEHNHTKAQYEIGEIYRKQKDLEKAERFYKLAADKKHSYAQYELAKLLPLTRLNPVSKDSIGLEARTLYREAAESFQTDNGFKAQFYLGEMHEKEWGVKKDPQKMCECYRKTIFAVGNTENDSRTPEMIEFRNLALKKLLEEANENTHAQFNLAMVYEKGIEPNTVTKEEQNKKALSLYGQAIIGGHVEAHYRLAAMYESGVGIKRDDDKALNIYQKALRLNQGDKIAHFKIGKMYLEGRVKACEGDESIEKAIEHLEKADRKNPDVQFHLGIAYKKSPVDMQHDHYKTYDFIMKAAMQGHHAALEELEKTAATESPFTPFAKMALAKMYEKGQGVSQDSLMADRYYREGSETFRSQNANALYHYAKEKNPQVLYQLGLYEKTEEENVYFYERFIEVVLQGHPGALGELEEAANAESIYAPIAKMTLGKIYERGSQAVPKDLKKAETYYKEATQTLRQEASQHYGAPQILKRYASQNNPHALYEYALYLKESNPNHPRITHYLKEAKNRGHAEAPSALEKKPLSQQNNCNSKN